MVDLLVYTNHRMGDMYYNTPFPHNVLSIVTVLIFFWGRLFSGSRCSRLVIGEIDRFWFRKSLFTIRSEVKADVKKKALCWTRCMSDNDVCWTRRQGQKKRVSFLGRFGFLGIDAHTLKELVILQFRKCLSEDIVPIHLWSIVDNKSVGYSRVCVQIWLWRFRKCSIRFRRNV